MKTRHRSRLWRITTRALATLCVVGALTCFVVVAVGGAFPSYKRGSSIVAPRTGDVWQVGEMHTAQWTLNHVKTTNSSGDPMLAKLILAYSGGSQNAHVLLADLTDWFPVTDRLANVMVPSVPTREDYSLYLFSKEDHDVSAWSGYISIFNPDDVEGTDQPPDKLTVTTAPPVSVTMSLTSTFSDSALSTVSDSTSLASAIASVVNGTESPSLPLSGLITALVPATTTGTTTESVVSAAPATSAKGAADAKTTSTATDAPVMRVQTLQSTTGVATATTATGADDSADARATPNAISLPLVRRQTFVPSPTHRMKHARRCREHGKRLHHQPRQVH
ncbi:hypothetical protein L226DRAFT_240192 [Lentinus tigrinus ALCF2SS1-7]|uniref:Uncharacterized protein n=1 Tax=Lentinus tigrinus ALCF2SS1-6 TaxID=1328759 RepID=A0A5C2SNS1_9APHY|nr:hypothetical protein L227DRAFT_590854 [Lentinus tigrinus ALCF2SS1-6]RPD79094.1 hypothetical protein L226DRAFT_240192 [Lentinus tigrinus ALCF2SS1-7]